MNDDKLLRARAEKAEEELQEERRYCDRCYELHRHMQTALRTELEAARAEVAALREWGHTQANRAFLATRAENRNAHQREEALAELREARALLARWRHHWLNENEAPEELAVATRAFLDPREEKP